MQQEGQASQMSALLAWQGIHVLPCMVKGVSDVYPGSFEFNLAVQQLMHQSKKHSNQLKPFLAVQEGCLASLYRPAGKTQQEVRKN